MGGRDAKETIVRVLGDDLFLSDGGDDDAGGGEGEEEGDCEGDGLHFVWLEGDEWYIFWCIGIYVKNKSDQLDLVLKNGREGKEEKTGDRHDAEEWNANTKKRRVERERKRKREIDGVVVVKRRCRVAF